MRPLRVPVLWMDLNRLVNLLHSVVKRDGVLGQGRVYVICTHIGAIVLRVFSRMCSRWGCWEPRVLTAEGAMQGGCALWSRGALGFRNQLRVAHT